MRCAWMFGIFALLFELIAALSVVMVFIKPVNQVVWWPLAIVSGAVAVALAILAWEVAQPRIQHRGVFLVVHLSPFRYERIPLNIVECFFLGSNPLDAQGATTESDDPPYRVGTVVIRLAERAIEYRTGVMFSLWGVWQDSSIVLDGRWCEPLSRNLLKDLASRLVDAKHDVIESEQS